MGRIVYLVHEASCTIEVVWIYNHDQSTAVRQMPS
jgi:hypothetical protein